MDSDLAEFFLVGIDRVGKGHQHPFGMNRIQHYPRYHFPAGVAGKKTRKIENEFCVIA